MRACVQGVYFSKRRCGGGIECDVFLLSIYYYY